MIIIKIAGGLGNQLFQYAFGLSMASFYKTDLKLDISDYKAKVGDPKLGVRIFVLDNFRISAPLASIAELKEFDFYKHSWFFKKLARFYGRPSSYYKRKYLIEPEENHFCFDKRVFARHSRGNLYCDGYFQSEKYFNVVVDQIRNEFVSREAPDTLNTEMLVKIAGANSVALHVRHGDNALAAKNNGVLSIDYYHEAIKRLAAIEKNLIFYIFSDDPEWVKENLHLEYPAIYVSHNGDAKNYEDLRLMINCRHHIIGNSTFSWWGAWLGKKPGQKVFAPRCYNVGVDVSGKDFYPADWIIV